MKRAPLPVTEVEELLHDVITRGSLGPSLEALKVEEPLSRSRLQIPALCAAAVSNRTAAERCLASPSTRLVEPRPGPPLTTHH